MVMWPAGQRPGFIFILVRRAGGFSSGTLPSWARLPLSSEGLRCWAQLGERRSGMWGQGSLGSRSEASCVAGPGGTMWNGAAAGSMGRERGLDQICLLCGGTAWRVEHLEKYILPLCALSEPNL